MSKLRYEGCESVPITGLTQSVLIPSKSGSQVRDDVSSGEVPGLAAGQPAPLECELGMSTGGRGRVYRGEKNSHRERLAVGKIYLSTVSSRKTNRVRLPPLIGNSVLEFCPVQACHSP